MENNMITVKGFRMSGKFGELNLDELTLPCTKEAWNILGNLADVASDAAEECFDTSEIKASTEPETTKNDNGVMVVKECLTLESMKRIFDSFNMIPKSGLLTYKTKFKTDLDESVYVRVSFYPKGHASVWVNVDVFPHEELSTSVDLKVIMRQKEVPNKLLDSDIGYIKSVIDSLNITEESWQTFKENFFNLLDSQNYRKFISNC